MTLPFPLPESQQRKYRCFVCESEFDNYEEFTTHIVDSHEQGREYILCQRCESPVRDVSMHYKVKHPGIPVQSGQLKAIVWNDTSGKKKKKPHFRNGTYISAKNGGKPMPYRSGWECRCYELLEEWNEVVAYSYEALNIAYFFQGEEHIYKPDLLIDFPNRRELWEIKPFNQKDLDKNKAKWHAAKEFCRLRDWEFMVITERGLTKLQRIIREQRADQFVQEEDFGL